MSSLRRRLAPLADMIWPERYFIRQEARLLALIERERGDAPPAER